MFMVLSYSVTNSLPPHGKAVARPTSLSMEFSRQEYCSGLPFLSPGDLPDPEILTGGWNVDLLHCRQILYHLSYQGSPGTQPLYTKFTK